MNDKLTEAKEVVAELRDQFTPHSRLYELADQALALIASAEQDMRTGKKGKHDAQ